MRLIIVKCILFVCVGLCSNTSSSQNLLTRAECRNKAIEYNKLLKVANLQQKYAGNKRKVAYTAYFPEINLEARTMFIPGMDDISMPGKFLPIAESQEQAMSGDFTGKSNIWMPGLNLELGDLRFSSAQLGIQMPLYVGGKIKFTNKIAETTVKMVNDAYTLKRSEIVLQTDQAFLNVVSMLERNKLAKENYDMLCELEEQIDDMYQLGLVPVSEKLKVAVKKNEAELLIIRSKNGLILSKIALNQLIGDSLNKEIEIKFDFTTEVDLPDFLNDLSNAAELRPELKLLKSKKELSSFNEKIVRSEYLPELGIGVNRSYMNINRVIDESKWNTIAAANLKIPIFHWKEGKYNSKAARIQTEQAELNLKNTNELIELEVNQARVQLEEAYEAVQVAKKGVAEADNNLEETKISFDLGLNNTTELLIAQTEWQKAQTNMIVSVTAFELYKSIWLKATGILY